MYLETYYIAYFSVCAILIVALARILHRAGAAFLNDAFAGNKGLVSAVTQLLDVGFYLMSFGFVGASFRTYEELTNRTLVVQVIGQKVGWFLLIMGFTHLFNLLILALFRGRRVTTPQQSPA
jgi:hypothetical protein